LINNETVFERFVTRVVGSAVEEASFGEIVRSSEDEVDVEKEGETGDTT
jgi:hypothetical protein